MSKKEEGQNIIDQESVRYSRPTWKAADVILPGYGWYLLYGTENDINEKTMTYNSSDEWWIQMLFHMCPYDASLWLYYYIRERPNITVDWSPMAYRQPTMKNDEMAVYWECIDSKDIKKNK